MSGVDILGKMKDRIPFPEEKPFKRPLGNGARGVMCAREIRRQLKSLW
jgi:hypothetical protein